MTDKMIYSFTSMSDYKIPDEDVDGLVRYLKIYDPGNANYDYAKQMLEFAKQTFRDIALSDIDQLADIKTAFDSSRRAESEPGERN